MADEKDNRIRSTKTWITWIDLEDGTPMKYGDKLSTKPEQSKQLKIELRRRMKNNDAAKRKRSKHTALKKSQVKYEDAIGKIYWNNYSGQTKTWRNIELSRQRVQKRRTR